MLFRVMIVILSGSVLDRRETCTMGFNLKQWSIVNLFFCLLPFIYISNCYASGNIEKGKARSGVCSACHGENGVAVIPGYPNLRGQSEQYLAEALTAYKNKQREGRLASIMQVQASLLSEQDIKDLAAYYASLDDETH